MTTAGDQVESITITNGGYGILKQLMELITTPNNYIYKCWGDTTGAGAVAYAILGGENAVGNGGASYRIKRIDYLHNRSS